MPRRRSAPRRPAIAHARVSAAELAAWQAKAAAAGVSLSELLRQAMARTQIWTAPARAVERARTRQIARIGSNLNQIARWAHTHVDDDLAVVEVLAHLVAIERRADGATRAGRGRCWLSSSPAAQARPRPRPTTCYARPTARARSGRTWRFCAGIRIRWLRWPTHWSLSTRTPRA